MTSKPDSENELKEYCAEWLRRHRTAEMVAPYVQRMYETAAWGEGARQLIDEAHVPEEITGIIDLKIAHNANVVRSTLPLPRDYQRVGYVELTALSSGVTSMASSMVAALIEIRPTAGISPEIDEAIKKYEVLHRDQGRYMGAHERLKNHFPSLVELLVLAENKFQQAKGDHNQIPGAATEMRNLVDRLRGELFAKANRRPKENMNWTTMSERLCEGDSLRQQTLLDQEVLDGQIRGQLGDLVHRQTALDATKLSILWLLIVDFVFLVCDLKSAATPDPGTPSASP